MKQQIRVSVNVSVSERSLGLSEMDKDSSIEARDHRIASHFDGFGFLLFVCVFVRLLCTLACFSAAVAPLHRLYRATCQT